MQRCGWLTDGTAYIEFGAGRARLTSYLLESIGTHSNSSVLLVDRDATRNKVFARLWEFGTDEFFSLTCACFVSSVARQWLKSSVVVPVYNLVCRLLLESVAWCHPTHLMRVCSVHGESDRYSLVLKRLCQLG